MITDARVLRTGFVPQEVKHRDAEVTHLTEILAPLTDGNPADTTLLTGPSGAGKTCLAQYTAEQLRQEVLDVEYQYVNCWQNFSEFRTLYRILEGLGKTVDIHRQSTPRDELFERLRQYDGPPCVVILDEADQLEEKRLLYHLHELPQFSMLLIANREQDLFASADERLTSRLTGCEQVRFDRYSADELVAILDARVKAGLEEGVIDRDQLATIADAALERAADDGRGIQPGQGVAYVVVDDTKQSRDRVRLPDEATTYDTAFYTDQLVRAAESVLAPLGWRQADIEAYLADKADASLDAFRQTETTQ